MKVTLKFRNLRWNAVILHRDPVDRRAGSSQNPAQRAGNQDSAPNSRPAAPRSSRGIALIVTLIMLAVITFLTVTFLVLSQRETGSVTTSTDQLLAKQAADSAADRAKIELLGPMLAFTNAQLYNLLVSTNFISSGGYFSGALPTGANPFTNVSYTYGNGAPLNNNDRLQNLANLLYNPRPPVFMTNRVTRSNEFRFYHDLNRNGQYDANGWWPELGVDGNPIVVDGATNYGWHIGDPEWIGVLERPELPHSSTNKFIARYCYVAVPVGKTLDVNYSHNQAKRLGAAAEGFFRNQGVGSYEINLGAFFTDLNPNIWGASNIYSAALNFPSTGLGYEDALSILRYRYAGNYANLQPARDLFPFNAAFLTDDGVDQYADGGLMGANRINENLLPDPVTQPWAGADNPNHFFTVQDFFDRNKITVAAPVTFVDRLERSGTNVNSFDRHTYYRMLAQLGTDSEPDRRMNVNHLNVDANMNVVPGMETNLIPWIPLQFFTNAADRMLRAQFPYDNISVTNIPVMLTNRFVYSPDVNRLLQLAANMYEATTNTAYPRLFRPYFQKVVDDEGKVNVFIRGFEEAENRLEAGNLDLSLPIDIDAAFETSWPNGGFRWANIYGVPWIIGSRKGLPNLNEVTAASRFNITRRIQVTRPSLDASASSYILEEQYLMDLYYELGAEVWNSYHTNFPGAQISVSGTFSYALTNQTEFGSGRFGTPAPITFNRFISTNNWPGYSAKYVASELPAANSFIVPIRTNFMMLTNVVFNPQANTFHTDRKAFYPMSTRPMAWGLVITNRLRVIIADANGRIFDYVQLQGPSQYRDLSSQTWTAGGTGFEGLWDTNLVQNSVPQVTRGVNYQLAVSRGSPEASESDWRTYGTLPTGGSRSTETQKFRDFWNRQSPILSMQAPFTPTKATVQRMSWQANDPLVHYLEDDLVDITRTINVDRITPPTIATNMLANLGVLNDRYTPWGGNPLKTGGDREMAAADPFAVNVLLKDSGVLASQFWDFPTNKLADIGWLGNVHRGTPWQTVYLKSGDILRRNALPDNNGLVRWQEWTGHRLNITAANTAPVNDRMLFDLFTAVPNENAGRGRLSVNQTNLAAWSAVLSGVQVISNDFDGNTYTTDIQPAAISPQVQAIVAGLIRTKNQLVTNNNLIAEVFPQREFRKLGDVLGVPELSLASPFLNTNRIAALDLPDYVVERIPQQTLGLLGFSRSPRFVIYAYGQSLRPAPESIVRTFGAFSGMCTNYQVTAESASRSVVRVEGSFDPRDVNGSNSIPHMVYPPRLIVEQYNVLPPD